MKKKRIKVDDNYKCDRIVKTLPYILKISELRKYLKVSTWSVRRWSGLFSDESRALPEFPKRTRMSQFRVWLFEVGAVEQYLHLEQGEIGSKVILDPLLTVKEVSEKVGRTEWTVYQWISQGKLRVIRIGHGRRVIRISPDHLKQFINDHKDWLEEYAPKPRKKRRRSSRSEKDKIGSSSSQHRHSQSLPGESRMGNI